MKTKLTQFIAFSSTLAAWVLGIGGCSTTEVIPQAPPAVAPPPYVQVAHPTGFDMGDLRAIFTDRSAPKPEDLKDCDADLKTLKSLTQSEAEIAGGVRELIKHDPVKYHWCFYSKILKLEDDMKTESFVDERQKKVLETYAFLAPVGRGFMQEYHDSRYMRWAVKNYRQLSEWVFYRKLDLTPQSTVDLVEAANPFGFFREPTSSRPILEKYNILKDEPVAPPMSAPPASPLAAEAPAPAAPQVGGREPAAIPPPPTQDSGLPGFSR